MASQFDDFVKHAFFGSLLIALTGALLDDANTGAALKKSTDRGTVDTLPEDSTDRGPGKYWYHDLLEAEEEEAEPGKGEMKSGKDVPRGRLCRHCVDHALPKGGKEGALFKMCTKKIGPSKDLCVIQSGRYDPRRPQFTDAAAGMCVPSPWGGEDKSWPDGKKRWCDADQGKWGEIQTGQLKACSGKQENDKCSFVTPGILQNQDGSYHCKEDDEKCKNGRCEYGVLNGVKATQLWCNIWNPECAIWKTSCPEPSPAPPAPSPARRRRRRRGSRGSRRRKSGKGGRGGPGGRRRRRRAKTRRRRSE